MFGLSTSHLLILGFIALLFGSRKLPEVGSSMGSAIRAFKAAIDGQPMSEQRPMLPSSGEGNKVAQTEGTRDSKPV